jgi:DNA-binding HxlR family transcriptional regulator
MDEKIYVTARCPIRTALDLVGGKWKLLILKQLGGRPLRPSELRTFLPDISEKMLVQELRILERNGLVGRKQVATSPPRVEYSLTERGRLTRPLMEAMAEFAAAYERLSRPD